MSDPYSVPRVRDALVHPGWERLYSESPEFKMGIDLLARVLPRFVDLMAEDARRTETVRRVMQKELEFGPITARSMGLNPYD